MTAESGFNSRVMWRGEDLMTYVYYAGMDPATNCGEDWHWNVATTSGQWHTIEMYIKVNTPGALPPSGASYIGLVMRVTVNSV